jgi:uncharacterized protein YbjT (DUF2867 family)
MRILVTGAAGNFRSATARPLLDLGYQPRPMICRRSASATLGGCGADICIADLAGPGALVRVCQEVDWIILFIGILLAPFPEKLLPETNIKYVDQLLAATRGAGVTHLISIIFPHIERESTSGHPAAGLP